MGGLGLEGVVFSLVPLQAGNELYLELLARMGLFLCVNDRKQTLGNYLAFSSASS